MSDYFARASRLIAEQPAIADCADDVVGRLHQLCGAAAEGLSGSGAGVSVLAHGGAHGALVASDPLSRRIEEAQFLLGEGPCVDALETRRPVLVGELDAAAMSRWPRYCPAAHDAGVRAVFAFPLQVGGAQLGVLDVFREFPGPLSADELTQALSFAEVAVNVLLDGQDAASGTMSDGWDEAVEHHAAVFQAQGMVMVQLGVSLVDALIRLRAYAYTRNRRLIDVARDVVARTLRLDADR